MKKRYEGENPDFGKRIKKIREVLNISQKDFSAKLDIAQSFLSSIESQNYHPGFGFFVNMYEQFKVNPNYVMLGIGPMFLTGYENPANDSKFGNQGKALEELIPYLHKSEIVRIAVINFAWRFIDSNKYVIEMDMKSDDRPVQPTEDEKE